MRIPIVLTTLGLVILSLVGGDKGSTCSTTARLTSPVLIGLTSTRETLAPRFSSTYTALTKCGSGMTRKEEREAEKNGSDIPTRCNGPAGYAIFIYYSACASHITAVKGDESISLSMQAVNWKQKTVEWRLANGNPFAVIMREYKYSGDDMCATNGKVVGESLVVKGLKGYEHIDETIDVKATPNPNAKAREIADKGYTKS